jgi:peptidoglycan/LPS O-acetylase OafA/YrhL
MLAGILFSRAPTISPVICLGLFVGSVVAFSASVYYNVLLECQSGLWKYRVIFWGMPAFALVLSLVLLESEKAITSWPWLLLASGDRSYSIYLTHSFLILPIGTLLKRISLTTGYADAVLMLVCVLCVLPGWISYRFIEKPVTKFLRDAFQTRSITAKC